MNVINQTMQKFHELNVQYMHWKSTNHLSDTFKAITDIDILVDKGQLKICERILKETGFVEFQTVYLRSYPGIHDYLLYCDELGWVHFHLHYQLNLGDRWSKNYHFPYERALLNNRVFDEEFGTYTVNPADEIYLFFLRMRLKYRHPMKSKQLQAELNFLLTRYKKFGCPRCSLNETLYQFSDLRLTDMRSTIESFNGLQSSIKANAVKLFRRYSPIRYYLNVFIRKMYRYYVEVRRRKMTKFNIGRRRLKSGGRIIVFLGTDGSGKSSNIRKAEKFFAKQMNTATVFLGSGASGANLIRKIIFSVYGRRRFTSKLHKVDSDGKKSNLFYMWNLLSILDRENNLHRLIVEKGNGSLVLVDRWPNIDCVRTDALRLSKVIPTNWFQDYVVKKERDFFERVSNISPDLVIKLVISPETAISRKPGEFDYGYALDVNKEIKSRVDFSESSVEIDANQDFDFVSAAVRKEIWSVISK